MVINCQAQVTDKAAKDSTVANPNYDEALAKQLGADEYGMKTDEYGMKTYMLVILKTGTNQTQDKNFISECFRGHLENINRLVEEGKLVIAGPLEKNDKTYRGIFILNVSTKEEAEALLQTDPAVNEGLLDAEIFKWFGSAAISTYLKESDKIWKVKP